MISHSGHKIKALFQELLKITCDVLNRTEVKTIENCYEKYDYILIGDAHIEPESRTLYKTIMKSKKVIPLGSNVFTEGMYNIPHDMAQKINQYYIYVGDQNLQSMIYYMGHHLFDRHTSYEEVVKTDFDGIFHIKTETVFQRLEDYLNWYKEHEQYIGIMVHRSDYINGRLALIEAMTENLEDQGIGVIPIFTYASESDEVHVKTMDEMIDAYLKLEGRLMIDLLVNLTILIHPVSDKKETAFEKSVATFAKLNIPIIKPTSSFMMSQKDWHATPMPLTYEMSYNYVTPEQIGAVESLFVSCKGDHGTRQILMDRVDKLCRRMVRQLHLKNKDNKDKKIAIMLHNAPCASVESTLGISAGLEAFESAVRLMKRLKSEGYRIDHLPETGEALRQMIVKQSAFSDFRWTPVDKIVNAGGVIYRMSKDTYVDYFNGLSEAVRNDVIKFWQAPIGESMVYDEQLVITGIDFGNVLVMIQPKRGCYGAKCTGEVCLILQDPKAPPSHHFLATYHYLNSIFKADAVIDMGTHGCVEFLPGKSVALTSDCYPDLVMGEMLSLYVYNSGVGSEGILAKRRMNSVIIDHFPERFHEGFKFNHTLGEIYDENILLDIIVSMVMEDETIETPEDVRSWILSGHHDYGTYFDEIRRRLLMLDLEIDNIIRALNLEYIQPVKSGVPEDQGLDMMPTGRNFFIFDSKKIPTKEAYAKGKILAETLIEKHYKSDGRYPEKIALNMISTDISQAGGEELSQIFHLLGVTPIWDKHDQVIGLEVIPMSVLERPRIDITLRISGVLRDSYPMIIELIDYAIERVHEMDESHENNFLKKHTDALRETMKKEAMKDYDRASKIRIFGDKPGAYGAGVDLAIKASAWKTEEDLASVFVQHSAFAYGKNIYGENRPFEFVENIKKVDISYDVSNSRRCDMFGSSFGTSVNGGYYLLTKHFGKDIKQYAGSREAGDINITTLNQAVSDKLDRTFHNKKWKSHLMTQNYQGTMELLKHVQNVFDWKIVKNNIADDVLDEIISNYINDPEIKAWFLKQNPYALEEMARRMLELKQRALYEPDDKVLEALTMTYLEFEGTLESDIGSYDTELQGGGVDIITSDEVLLWKKEIDDIKKFMK